MLECAICFESKPSEQMQFLPCVHFLCDVCFSRLQSNLCPFCREKFKDSDSSFSEPEPLLDEDDEEEITYLATLMENEMRSGRRRGGRRSSRSNPSTTIGTRLNNQTENSSSITQTPLPSQSQPESSLESLVQNSMPIGIPGNRQRKRNTGNQNRANPANISSSW